MPKGSIGIIGCGNMGGAIASGIVSRGNFRKADVYVYDKDAAKAEELCSRVGCRNGELTQIVRGSDVIVIAVKPLDFSGLSGSISADLVDQTVVSVMAGVRINDIVSGFGKNIPVVRAMPNLCAGIGRSVTALSFNEQAEKVQAGDRVREIFRCIGDVVDVKETMMDMVTAVSGSGPAYLFSLAEAMMEAAIVGGLSRESAKELVLGTLSGASELLKKSDHEAADLVKMVASKGGTTEA
ncbi:MAG TPA: pyrroline-5-carboxylate reductase, partial [Candidatus Omnitrophota bacterium]|nr:pyrroline-5-carboxylate reductase [Candidatus Omnitrophota bacterium]